jgi:hypothetical protein
MNFNNDDTYRIEFTAEEEVEQEEKRSIDRKHTHTHKRTNERTLVSMYHHENDEIHIF